MKINEFVEHYVENDLIENAEYEQTGYRGSIPTINLTPREAQILLVHFLVKWEINRGN